MIRCLMKPLSPNRPEVHWENIAESYWLEQ